MRACGSAIAHVRAVFQVRKGCEASWNCVCEVCACGGIFGVRSQVRSHLKFFHYYGQKDTIWHTLNSTCLPNQFKKRNETFLKEFLRRKIRRTPTH